MSFAQHPAPDACRAPRPLPDPAPPGPPPNPFALLCWRPKGHDGPHSLDRVPHALSRTWDNTTEQP